MSDIAATNVTERLNKFNHDLVQVERKWKTYTIGPYALAYEAAFQNYEKTIKDQQEADKAKAELIFLALSLVGGGVMTAALGTIALKALARRAAIHVICENNMERAFKAAYFMSNNKTANFIAGGVWDELEKRGKDYVSGKLKKAIENMDQKPAAFPSAQKLTTITVKTSMENFIGEALIKAYDLADGISEDPRLRNYEKLLKFTELRKSKLWAPPERSVDDGTLSDEIELSFYMNTVMNSDYLRTKEEYWADDARGGRMRETKTHDEDIHVSPGSANYPSPSDNQSIGYRKIGSIIKDRMNELHNKKFKKWFYNGESALGIMLKAEETIKLLANDGIQKKIAAAARAAQ
jgi:hypothetical protein